MKAFAVFGNHIPAAKVSSGMFILLCESPETTASHNIQSEDSAPPYKPWKSEACCHTRHINHNAYYPFQGTAFAEFLLKKLETAFPSAGKPCSVLHNPPPLPPLGHKRLEYGWCLAQDETILLLSINWLVVKSLLSSLNILL